MEHNCRDFGMDQKTLPGDGVISGTGTFVNGPRRHGFKPGDLLFVPAGTVHRFEDFSDDFSTWVVFYGPIGGE